MLSVVVLISTLLFLFVQVPQGAGLLLEVLRYASENVDKSLEQELRVIIEVSSLASRSSTINSADLAGLAKHVCAARCNTTFNQTMANSKDSFERFWSLTEDPGLAIATRRSVLACIILHWILQKERKFDDHAEKDLENITRWFYNVHLHSVAQRGLLEYLHISKSGGTSFSEAAALNDCSMAPGIGQVEELGDLPRWINGTAFEEVTGGIDIMWSYYSTKGRPSEGQTCTRRRAYLKEFGYNYVSNEFTLHGGSSERNTHVCPQMVNVVTLRDPDTRLASHLHYMLARVKKRLLGKNGKVDEGNFFDIFCAGNVTVWERLAPTAIDNYNVRSFIGERGFHMPVGGIGPEDVEIARRLLLQFDLVLDLDAGSETVDLAIQQGLGWNLSMLDLHVRSSSWALSKLNYSKEDCPNDELLRTLRNRQNPDRALYSTGRTLALLDGVFLGVARALGLRPVVLATMEVAAGVLVPRDETGCGLMRPAAVEGARRGDAATARGGGGKASRSSAK
ncbi:hypothetical protein Vretifemale_4489 [Volvox reticuliferus]|uniref:Uncharacterized protein n=1 Tax=Volvox reticuliferus TaxID=1737510 RepID=A0A8J4C307_9CHLO|nr:hypothetical protein Vretifemale_4489 [Volvox reticuliferus]